MAFSGKIKEAISFLIPFLILFIICNSIYQYIIKTEFNEATMMEDIKDDKIVCYDLNTIVLFDSHVFCLSKDQCRILVLTEDGKFKKNIQLPHCLDNGIALMYIFNDQLCILDKRSNLYQYSDVNSYRKIVPEDENTISIYEMSEEKKQTINIPKAFSEVLLVSENKYYLYSAETESIFIYDGNHIVDEKTIDYEKVTNLGGSKVFDAHGFKYEIGNWGDKIYRIERGTKTLLWKSTIFEKLFCSYKMTYLLTVIVLLLTFWVNQPLNKK